MVAFALCLVGAGIILTLLARLPGLVMVLAGLVVVISALTILGVFAVDTTYSLPVNLVVGIVALQIGYGLGVVLRAVLGHSTARVRSRTVQMGRRDPVESPEKSTGEESVITTRER
ncbi:hypothetical protein G3T14_19415 [Methylobacterium sp. BTF04]|uniref:hypothetical protein n=1 Tax=Methylobacterium sp. BTF04 TaxID=2708300 RepID=UPI0013D68BAB|nr:hypothetical protein [Methylobacterium sp. BTF04]NEU14279.1 hypothetical protein [Methylobacterium sp. BTF04]